MNSEQQERLLKAAKAALNIMAGYYVDDEYEELKEAISAAESAAPGNLEAELRNELERLRDIVCQGDAESIDAVLARKTEGAK